MKKIFVPDMHCEHCVKRIGEALKNIGVEAEISLISQTVTVSDDDLIQKAFDEIYDIGFTPELK